MATAIPEAVAIRAPTWRRRLASRPLLLAGCLLVAAIGLLAVLAPLVSSFGPTEIDPAAVLVAPGADGHLLGTDRNGMDIWARLLYAARVDLGIAVAAVGIAVAVGTTLGAIVGYLGGWLDELGMRVVDMFQAFPAFILALAVAALVGPGTLNLIAVLALVNAPGYLRLMRTEVRSTREHGYVEAARAAGAPWWSVLFRQVVPNSLRPVLVIAPLNCGWAILTLAGLSFLGLGVRIPNPEWGAMIAAGADDMVSGDWWTSVFPGIALFVTVLGFNLVGEGLLAPAHARRLRRRKKP
jgi:peptide/nickel transport system permease protein